MLGTGSIVFGSASDSTSIYSPNEIEIDGSSPLTIASGITVTGPSLDANGLVDSGLVVGPLLMLGTFAEDAGGTITIQGPLQNLAAGTLTGGTWEVSDGILQLPSDVTANAANIAINSPSAFFENGAGTNGLLILNANLATGTLTLGAGASLALTESFANAGTVDIANGATLSDIANYSQTGGITTVEGTLEAAQVNLNGGLLNGAGLVQADVTNAATITPDDATVTLTIQGNYTQSAAGTLNVALESADGVLTVTGTVTLSGTLAIAIGNAFVPPPGTPVTLLTFGQRAGASDFSSETGLGVLDQEFPTLAYSSTSLASPRTTTY